MILDKRPRALIFAFFCLAAALGGAPGQPKFTQAARSRQRRAQAKSGGSIR